MRNLDPVPGIEPPTRPSEAPPGSARSLTPVPQSPAMNEFLDILKPLIREPSVVETEDSLFRVPRRELEEVDVRVQCFHGVMVGQGNRPSLHRTQRV